MEDNTVELDIDEANEMSFKMNITGPSNGGSAEVRLVCEGSSGMSYIFTEKRIDVDNGNVVITIPKMSGKLDEGVHKGQIEVIVDEKHLVPLKFEMNFKKQVIAEATIASVVKPRQNVHVASAVVTNVSAERKRVSIPIAAPKKVQIVEKKAVAVQEQKKKEPSALHKRWQTKISGVK
jgi:hypothetical protein